jgi:putative tryptophan/tyrosine transport system substrate-binding protein
MRRRDVLSLLGGAVSWPVGARAQQSFLPVIGFLHAGSFSPPVAAFPRTLAEAGYLEKQNVKIEYRYAEGQYDRLPELAADLVRRNVTVIVASPNNNAARAAQAATKVIPTVFMVSDDPVKLGLVVSLSHPGGNATGVNYFISELVAKRLGLLRELLPNTTRVGALVNPNAETTQGFIKNVTAAAAVIGIEVELVYARDNRELEVAFAKVASDKVDALTVAPDTFFATGGRERIVSLATRYAIPAIYTVREYVENGGLMSYGPSVPDAYRQLALYASRILQGAKPADLPVVQSAKFDFVINLPTARALGLEIPPSVLALATEVIE